MTERLIELFYAFWQIGFFSIGGGYAIIPLIQEQVVEKYGWLTEKVFADIITISQMTPGPLAVNTSTFVGLKAAGLPGAAAATLGCIISGVVIALLLDSFFQKHSGSYYIPKILNSLKAASLGLIMSAGAVILLLTFCGTSDYKAIQDLDVISVFLFLGAFFAMRKWKLNPILLMVICGILGGFLYI